MKTALWLQDGTYPAAADRQLITAVWPGGGRSGAQVVGIGGHWVVHITPGRVAVPLADGTCALCAWDAVQAADIPPPPAGQNREDRLVVQVDPAAGTFGFEVVPGPPHPPGDPANWAPLPPDSASLSNYTVWYTDDDAGTINFPDNGGLGSMVVSGGPLSGDATGPAQANRVTHLTQSGAPHTPRAVHDSDPGDLWALVWSSSWEAFVPHWLTNRLIPGAGIDISGTGFADPGQGWVTVSAHESPPSTQGHTAWLGGNVALNDDNHVLILQHGPFEPGRWFVMANVHTAHQFIGNGLNLWLRTEWGELAGTRAHALWSGVNMTTPIYGLIQAPDWWHLQLLGNNPGGASGNCQALAQAYGPPVNSGFGTPTLSGATSISAVKVA